MDLQSAQMPLPPAHSAVVVRSLLAATPIDRQKILEDVEYNVFAFPAGLITCDFLSDSGTSAMTDVQWAARKHISPYHTMCNSLRIFITR
jgi:tryptophanase